MVAAPLARLFTAAKIFSRADSFDVCGASDIGVCGVVTARPLGLDHCFVGALHGAGVAVAIFLAKEFGLGGVGHCSLCGVD